MSGSIHTWPKDGLGTYLGNYHAWSLTTVELKPSSAWGRRGDGGKGANVIIRGHSKRGSSRSMDGAVLTLPLVSMPQPLIIMVPLLKFVIVAGKSISEGSCVVTPISIEPDLNDFVEYFI